MIIEIDFSRPYINEKTAESLTVDDLYDSYEKYTETDQANLYFVMLNSAIYFEKNEKNTTAAHMYYLIAYYLFDMLTPPASCDLACLYAEKAVHLDRCMEYEAEYRRMLQGN